MPALHAFCTDRLAGTGHVVSHGASESVRFGHMSATLELADRLHVSDRTLRRAVARGLLRGVRSSPNKLAMTAAERDYAQSHWMLLGALVRVLRTEPGVQAAVLYGSVAKGLDRADSDVDLVVDLRPGASASIPALDAWVGRLVVASTRFAWMTRSPMHASRWRSSTTAVRSWIVPMSGSRFRDAGQASCARVPSRPRLTVSGWPPLGPGLCERHERRSLRTAAGRRDEHGR